MRRLIGVIPLVVLAAGLFAGPLFAQELKVGDQAPDFKLPGSDGRTYSLAELRGKTVVWPGFPRPSPVAEPPNATRSVRAGN